MRTVLFLLALFFSLPALAGELTFQGQFIQGGLVIGTTQPGAIVKLGKRTVRVSAEGRFVLGFGRDHGETAILTVRPPQGQPITRTLKIAKRSYDIQRIDGLPPSKVNPPAAVWKRIKAENAQIGKVRRVDRPEPWFESGFIWPAIGRISGVYGSQRVLNGEPKRPHFGVDVAAPVGTPVKAPADGIVVLAEKDLYYTGGTLIIDHGHGLTSAFLHLDSLSAKVGQKVKQGEVVAALGGTGRATGPHLDWRMNWFNQRVDPALLVGPMPDGS